MKLSIIASLHRAAQIGPLWRPVFFAATVLFASGASAQTYPDRPIRVVVPFSAGSASDVVTRLVLDKMSPALGQQFIVENQPGAGGNIGTALRARSPAATTW
jgi:tripartite-type tricarboxylate transporter receptor subunit TctC